MTHVRTADKNVLLVAPKELLNVSDVDGIRVALRIIDHFHFRQFIDRYFMVTDFAYVLSIGTPFEG